MRYILSKCNRSFNQGTDIAVVVFSAFLSCVIFVIDLHTGNQIHISAFYLFPVCLITWYFKLGWGLVAAFGASAAWSEAEYLVGFRYTHTSITVWNLAARMLYFAVAVALVDRIRMVMRELDLHKIEVEKQNERLRLADEAVQKSHDEMTELAWQLEKRVEERTAQLSEQAILLRQLAVELTEAEQSERKRLAQMLHGRLQQLLVAANIRLALLEQATSGPDRKELRTTREFIEKATQESRSLTAQLRPPLLYESGLADGLRFLARKTEEERKVKVHLALTPGVNPESDLIKIMLYECVEELLLNASKHAGVKECFLSLNKSPEGDVSLTLRDAGFGFDPNKIGRRDGGGFGLFSLRERIRALNGTFKIDSAPTKGAFFEITLPDRSEPSASTRRVIERRKTVHRETVKSTQGLTVVLADDHKIVRQSLAKLLLSQPFIGSVIEADDGADAVSKAQDADPDVVILDVTMPRMNGIEATRILRQTNPRSRIFGLSVHSEAEMAEVMKEAGAAAYFTKDEDAESLVLALTDLAESR